MPNSQAAVTRRYHELSEPELARLARSWDRGAFAEIMQRLNPRLFRVARAVVRDEPEAEDVVQEAYTRAFTKLDSFQGEASLSTWLTSITLNEARGRLRARKTTVDLEALDAAQAERGALILFRSPSAAASPEADAARTEARRLLEHALDDLPEPFRIVFILREIDELSVAETAESLGLRPETVKTRLHRARRLLRAALDEKLAAAVKDAFPFLGARCEKITRKVLDRLAPAFES